VSLAGFIGRGSLQPLICGFDRKMVASKYTKCNEEERKKCNGEELNS